MKKFYLTAWFLLAAAAIFSVLTGSFSPGLLIAFSFAALGLVFWLMLWSVVVNTRDLKTE